MLNYDSRRKIFTGKTKEEAIAFATDHWVHAARQAIQQRGKFAVALSGGSTPKAIYQELAKVDDLDWSKVLLFWSDERSVGPNHPDSNYKMAMEYFGKLPIQAHQIFRMQAEGDLELGAKDYEEKIRHHLDNHLFDLVMLGLGEDGHTASLFPETKALEIENRLVVPNYVEAHKTWRMTFTFPCINRSAKIALYSLGTSKASMVERVLKAPIESPFPASKIGTATHPALWILDREAGKELEMPDQPPKLL